MSTFSRKNIAFLVATILVTQYTFAATGELFCTPDDKTGSRKWVETDKPVDRFTNLVHKVGGATGTGIVRLNYGLYRANGLSYFLINNGNPTESNGSYLHLYQAKEFCNYLRTFCPNKSDYIGVSYTRIGVWSRIALRFKESSSVGELWCPTWDTNWAPIGDGHSGWVTYSLDDRYIHWKRANIPVPD